LLCGIQDIDFAQILITFVQIFSKKTFLVDAAASLASPAPTALAVGQRRLKKTYIATVVVIVVVVVLVVNLLSSTHIYFVKNKYPNTKT